MDEHIKLMGLLLNSIFGVALLVYILHQKKRYGGRILGPLAGYTGGTVTGILFFYLTLYMRVNLRLPPASSDSSLLEAVIFMVAYTILIIISCSIITICFRLQGNVPPPWLKKTGRILILLILLGFAGYFFSAPASILYRISHFTVENFAGFFLLAEIFFLIRLFFCSRKKPSRAEKGLGNSFSLLFLSRYLVLPLFVFLVPSLLRGFLFLIFFQGIGLVWIRFFYLPYLAHLRTGRKTGELAAELAKTYHLSTREKEILDLMLLGKNNREIEDQLYISYNTVKNHIHSIYRKTGLKNRYQLFLRLDRIRFP